MEKLIFYFLMNLAYPKILNKIINFGGNNFRYSHFSFYSNGDMILDCSSYPSSEERKFFGLKKNGEYLFNSSECEGSICSIKVDHSNGRIEGESYCIKLTTTNSYYNGKELFLNLLMEINI